MALSAFYDIDQVLARYPLRIERKLFLPDAKEELPDWMIENFRFSLEMSSAQEDKAYLEESFIFPLLHQAWKSHPKLKLWSHRTIQYNSELLGDPDYLLAARPEGVIDKLLIRPVLAVVEAKKEDFEKEWGQCLDGMLVCQKNNGDEKLPIYGIVTNGLIWMFGMLIGQTLTQHPLPYSLSDATEVLGVVQYIFAECEKNLIEATSPITA